MDSSSIKHFFTAHARQGILLVALVGIWAVFGILTEGTFISPRNLSNLFIQSSITAILTVGMVLVIVTGYIDLSVGSVVGFIGMLLAVALVKSPVASPWAFTTALTVAVMIGLWHGFWIAYQKVPAFIVTLASMLVFRGAIIGLSGGKTVATDTFRNEQTALWLEYLGNGYLPSWGLEIPLGSTLIQGSSLLLGLILCIWIVFKGVAKWRFGDKLSAHSHFFGAFCLVLMSTILSFYQGFPIILLIVMGLGMIFHFVAENTVFGRHLFAYGGQPESAEYSGINPQKLTLGLFAIMGILVGVAGILTVARLSAATTSAGQNSELDAIAAAVIGGTSLMGGQGSIVGALLGALLLTTLDNGMSLMNLDATFQFVIKGLILLIAVWLDLRSRQSVS